MILHKKTRRLEIVCTCLIMIDKTCEYILSVLTTCDTIQLHCRLLKITCHRIKGITQIDVINFYK